MKLESKYFGKYNFGLSLLNDRLCFYDYGNKNEFMNIISKVENIKQYEYDKVLDSDIEISIKTKNSESQNSIKGASLQNAQTKGMAFENKAIINIEKLFDNNNNLIELSSFLFPIEKYKDYDTADITLKNKIKYMFNFF